MKTIDRWGGRIPYLVLAGSLCLLGVDFLRLSVGGQTVPLTVALLFLWGGGLLIRSLIGHRTAMPMPGLWASVFWMLYAVFWLLHLVAVLRSRDIADAAGVHIKLTIGGVVCWLVVWLAPRIEKSIDRLWVVHLVAMSTLLLILIYRYAYVFSMPFLGISWDSPTRFGKNQIGWLLAVTMPYLAAFVLTRKKLRLLLIPLSVHVIAWLYTASRGSWACGGLGVLATVSFLFASRPLVPTLRRAIFLATILGVLGFAGAMVLDIPLDFRKLDAYARLLGEGGSNDVSDRVRLEMLDRQLDRFEQRPIIGGGLGSSVGTGEVLSHSDFLAILTDMGASGMLVFSAMLLVALASAIRVGRRGWFPHGAVGSIVAQILYFVFINAYVSPMFWVFLAFALIPYYSAGYRALNRKEGA